MSKKIIYALSFLIPFLIYLLTLAPDVYFTDSGELSAVASTLGVAHPTGYPLFTLIGHLFTIMLPFSEVLSLNIMAAVTTAASSFVFFNNLLLLLPNLNLKRNPGTNLSESNRYLLAFFTSLTYSFGLVIWNQAVAVEVYSLQLLMINLVLFFSIKSYYSKDDKFRNYLLTSFFLGLSFSNHLTAFMLIPGLLILFLSSYKGEDTSLKIKKILLLLIPFTIGISLYLFLPLRSAEQPIFNWGEVHRSFDKFIYHVTGEQYRVWMFENSETVKENLGKFFSLMPSQFTWIGLLFSVYGFFKLIKAAPVIFYSSILIILTCVIYSFNYSIHDIDSYFLTAYIFILIGLFAGTVRLVYLNKKLIYIFVIIPALLIFNNYSEADLSNDYSVKEYTNLIMQSADENAIIISSQWDYWVSAFWYKNQVEGKRKDISLIEKELLRRTWYVNQIQRWYPDITEKSKQEIDLYYEQLELFEEDKPYNRSLIQNRFINMINTFIDRNIDERPVYITLDILQTDPEIGKEYFKMPAGFLIRLSRDKLESNFNYKDFNISLLNESLENNTDHLHKGMMASAIVNLEQAYRYSRNIMDTTNSIEIYEMLKKLKK